jgi:hypothetical protein
MDGTDDDMLWKGSEEHGNFTSQCEEDGDIDNDWYMTDRI